MAVSASSYSTCSAEIAVETNDCAQLQRRCMRCLRNCFDLSAVAPPQCKRLNPPAGMQAVVRMHLLDCPDVEASKNTLYPGIWPFERVLSPAAAEDTRRRCFRRSFVNSIISQRIAVVEAPRPASEAVMSLLRAATRRLALRQAARLYASTSTTLAPASLVRAPNATDTAPDGPELVDASEAHLSITERAAEVSSRSRSRRAFARH